MSETVEIFLQLEGVADVVLVSVPKNATLLGLLEAVRAKGIAVPSRGENLAVFLEDSDKVIDLDKNLQDAGIGHRQRLHCHRCRAIGVTVNFNGRSQSRVFSPSATVRRTKKWADDKGQFDLQGADATDHVLQICGSVDRPDEDRHIGTLVRYPSCNLCFDLVPKVRVEG